jgi:hypothetical protein
VIPAAAQFIKEYPASVFQIISPDNPKPLEASWKS